MNLADLSAEFPRDAIHWRAQTLTKTGDKALALAYLDARDVMDRLDAVCGPESWQSRYTETPRGRVLCEIGIRVDGEWVWKSDGAGDTAVEGEKGGISDALKRAAVQWGIGRYLYRFDGVWAPCETYEKGGKLHWKAWRGSPWDSFRGKTSAKPAPPPATVSAAEAEILADLAARAGSDRAVIFQHLKVTGDSWADLPESLFTKVRDGMQSKLDKMEMEHDAAVKGP